MIENQLNELIAALNANTAALRDVLAKAGSPADAVTEPVAKDKPAKVKKEKLTVVEPEPAAEEPAAAAEEPEPADDLDTTEAISEETRSPEELHLAIRETVKPKLLADNAIQKNTKERWEKIRTDHGVRVLAEATDDQLPSILAAVEAL